MDKIKKIILMIFVFVFICTNTICADNKTYTYSCFYYSKDDSSITITGYLCNDKTSDFIPNEIAGLPVNSIASGAFVDTSLKELDLPDSIVYIGENSFNAQIKVNGLPDEYINNNQEIFDNPDDDNEDENNDESDDDKKDDNKNKDKIIDIFSGNDSSDVEINDPKSSKGNTIIIDSNKENNNEQDDEIVVVADENDNFIQMEENNNNQNTILRPELFIFCGVLLVVILLLIIVINKIRKNK